MKKTLTDMKNLKDVPSSSSPCSMHLARGVMAFGLIACFGALSGCSSLGGDTYGTGKSQEMALLRDFGGFLGDSDGKDKRIDYSRRPGLVLPPDGSSLPEPQKKKAALKTASNWPDDPDVLRAAYRERMENMTDKERKALLEAIRRLPPEQRDSIIKNDPRAVAFAHGLKEHDYSKGAPTNAESKAEAEAIRQRVALIKAANGKNSAASRQYLTQPPADYRTLTPEAQAALAAEEAGTETEQTKKKKRWFWPF